MGPAWGNGGKTQTLFLMPDIEKTYAANKTTHVLFDGEVFIGMQKILSQTLQGQLGLALAATSNANLSGSIWDDASPQFNNYTYTYKIQHTHLAAKAKLLADRKYWLIPWVGGSVGVGINNAHSFNNMPTIFEAVPNPNFVSHTEISCTYTASLGVQKAVNEHWQVGVGYEFAGWGKSNLGRAEGQTLNGRLDLNQLYTNGILLNFTYIA